MRSPVDRARALHDAGVRATADGRPAVARRQLRAAMRLLPGADEPELRGRVLVSLAHAEAEQGRVRVGLRLLGEAASLLPPERRGVLYGQRGLLNLRTGRRQDALHDLDAAVAVLQTEPAELARALLNRGVVHLGAADARAARADLRRCEQVAAGHDLGRIAAKARHNLGYLDYLAGDLPAALRAFDEVDRQYAVLAPAFVPVLGLDRARVLLAAGLFHEADRELAAVLDRFAAQHLSQDHAEAQLARAEAALLSGRPEPAREWATRARARFLRRGNALWAALAALVVLRADLAAGANPSAVARRALRLSTVFTTLDLDEDGRVAALVGVRALVAAGRGREAARVLADAGTARRSDRLDTRLLWRLAQAEVATGTPAGGVAAGRVGGGRRAAGGVGGAAGRGKAGGGGVDPAKAGGVAARHLRAGLDELQRYRSQLGCLDLQTGAAVHGQDLARAGLSAALASGSTVAVFGWSERARAQAMLLPPVRPPEDPAAAAALEELRHARTALRQAELARRPVGGLRARCEALRRTIREHAWFAAGPGAATRVATLNDVRAELGGAVVVTYLCDGDALYALVVGERVTLVPLGSYAEAAEAVRRLRADLDAVSGRALPARMLDAAVAATRADAARLGALVLDPLLRLVGDRDLVAVPTGVLVTVPWRLLPGCADRPVTVVPSATTWLQARRRRVARSGGGVLVVAGPGNAQGESEARAVAALLPGATVLTGAAATPAATLAGMDGAGLAHVAAHGHHEPENALFSSLDLAGGPLMGYDVQRLAVPPTTVVLSSCDLGLADVRPGDEALGMVAALLTTGTATVVASVSRVADQTAATVMTAYHRLAGEHSPAEALACAASTEPLSSFVCFGAG